MLEEPPGTQNSYCKLEMQKQFSEATYSTFDGFFFISKNSGLAFLSFLQHYQGVAEQGKGAWHRTLQELPNIHKEKSFLPQCSIQRSYMWLQDPNIMLWVQISQKDTKDSKIHDETSSEWVDLDGKYDTAIRVRLKECYYRTTVDIYGTLKEWYSPVTKTCIGNKMDFLM